MRSPRPALGPDLYGVWLLAPLTAMRNMTLSDTTIAAPERRRLAPPAPFVTLVRPVGPFRQTPPYTGPTAAGLATSQAVGASGLLSLWP